MSINLSLSDPGISLSKNQAGTHFVLNFTKDDVAVDIELPTSALTVLMSQAAMLLPSEEGTLSAQQVFDSWRQSVLPVLLRLRGRDWQLLLREVTVDDLVFAIWALEEEQLAHRIINNMTLRTAAMFVDMLGGRHAHAGALHTGSQKTLEYGAAAVQTVFQAVEALIARNEINKQVLG